MSLPDISSVAVVGCGPSGIASIYELLHTSKDGISTVGDKIAASCKFSKIVGFEQNHKAGGIWAPSFDKADLPIPPEELMNTEKYHDPDIIHPKRTPPDNVGTQQNPAVTKFDPLARDLEWRRSGIFKNLFTNIPSRFTRFSYMENDEKYYDKSRTIYPFMSYLELCSRVDKFVEQERISDYVRFNSSVQAVTKTEDGKWNITVKKTVDDEKEEWYQETFDAVIISSGHYSVPFFPHIDGLAEFNRNFPNRLMHANSYRTPDIFKGKKVLVIGGSISTINVLQYIVPVADSVTVSSRGNHRIFPWLDKAIRSDGIHHKQTIKEIDGKTGTVIFNDGSEDSGFDVIVFTTGYHFHYPFAKEYLPVINPSNYSRVSGLYYHTFSIQDPTLACVGVAASTVNFQSMEASAAFIAGIWSGAKKLPSKEEQRQWEEERRALKGDGSSFHYYFDDQITDQFINKIVPYYAHGRKSPLHVDGDHLSDVQVGIKSIEQLFYNVKSQRLQIQDTVYPA